MRSAFTERAEDGLAAVALAFLRGRGEARPDQVGLWGCSNATWSVPWAAARSGDAAFLIAAGATGVTGARAEAHRKRFELREWGVPDAALEDVARAWELCYAYAVDGRWDEGWDTEWRALTARLARGDTLRRVPRTLTPYRDKATVVTLERRLVDVGGAVLEVFAGGAAPAPVLCETHTHEAVSAEAGPLAEIAWLVRINPRGFGGSSPVRRPRDVSLDQLAEDVEAVRRGLGIARWVFHGYSGSAYVGYRYAVRHQGALAGLLTGGAPADMGAVVADPRSHFCPQHPAWRPVLAAWSPPGELSGAQGAGWARVRAGLWAYVQGGCVRFVLSGRAGADPSERMRGAFAESVLVDLTPRLHAIRVPTLYLHGRHDPAADVAHARATCAALPDAELVVFEHSRHGLQWQEPEKWRAVIERFLKQRVLAGDARSGYPPHGSP